MWYNKGVDSTTSTLRELSFLFIFFKEQQPSDSAKEVVFQNKFGQGRLNIFEEDPIALMGKDTLKPIISLPFEKHIKVLNEEELTKVIWHMTPTQALEYLAPYYMAERQNQTVLAGLTFNNAYLTIFITTAILLISTFIYLHLKNLSLSKSTPLSEIDKIAFLPLYSERTARMLSLIFLILLPTICSVLIVLKLRNQSEGWVDLITTTQLCWGVLMILFQVVIAFKIYIRCKELRGIINLIKAKHSG